MNDKICKGRKCFIVSMLFMLTFFFSIGFMEQSSKADTVNYSEGDFSYQLTQETKTATLQKYTGISQSVTIPSRIDWDGASYNVTVIGQNAFRDNTTITSINIPKGVLEIDNYAFYGCSVLSSVKLPTNCQLGKYIFYECDSLNEISIPEGTTSIYDTYPLDDDKEVDQKNDGACLAGDAIEKITFESGVTKVPSHLCEGLTQLKIIEWGNVASLGYHAFNRCESLTTIELPEKITTLPRLAFGGCKALTSVTIKGKLTYLGEMAFNNCSKMSKFTLKYPEELKTVYKDVFANCSELTELPIGKDKTPNLTYIGSRAFRECTIDTVTLPEGLTFIGCSAFAGCKNLKSINIPKSVQHIASNAFMDCEKLDHVVFPEDGKFTVSAADYDGTNRYENDEDKYSGGLFWGCKSLRSFTIPDSWTAVPGTMFKDCSALTSVHIPDNVTFIGNSAFGETTNLTSISLPSKLICIDGQAFKGCAIRSISLPNGLTQIGYQAFQGSELEQVVIPDSVKILGITNLATEGAFEDCEKMTSVVLGAGLQKLGGSEFQNCTSLVSVDLSKAVNIEEIPPYTFSGCSALEQIVIPSQIKKIGYGAFSNCTSLKADKVTMSENLQSMAGSVFSGCTSFTELPDLKSMTSIPEYTFSYCTGLVKVEVPDQIQTIGGQAFYNCTNLVAIGLGTGFDGTKLETWDTYIFYEMHNPSTIYTSTKEQADWLTANKTDRYLYSDYTDVKVGKVPENLVIPTPKPKPTPTPLVTPLPTPVPKTTPTPIPTPTQKTSGTPVKTPASNAKPTTAPANTNKNPKQAVLKAPVIKKVKAGKKKVSVSWKKSAQSITGYQIQYSTSASFKKGKKTITISGKKKQSRTIKKLKTKKKYYIRIRTYQVINGKKTVSKWSKTKKFKTK